MHYIADMIGVDRIDDEHISYYATVYVGDVVAVVITAEL
jgi:hypothetical protein